MRKTAKTAYAMGAIPRAMVTVGELNNIFKLIYRRTDREAGEMIEVV